MSLKDKIRKAALEFLDVRPAHDRRIQLQESIGFAGEVIRSRVWYRGDPTELSQFYKTYGNDGNDLSASTRFWAQVPEIGSIRKAHSGLPATLVNTLSHIITADMDAMIFDEETGFEEVKERWDTLARENDFNSCVERAITETLVTGDGAFKISIDPALSEHPILEFWAADRVEYEADRGRVQAVVFVSHINHGVETYTLKERYAPGEVSYELYDKDDIPRELGDIPQLQNYSNVEFGDRDLMLAIPVRFFKSTKYPQRGRSIFGNKTDAFDILDEVISQWLDAIRAGRVIRYIPRTLVPQDPKDGSMTAPSYFKTNYVITDSENKENSVSRIDMQQADIRYEAFEASYMAALDLCLQGIVSPATLGIDVGKMASAEAQREKKDVTGYTRGAITNELERVLPVVASRMLEVDDLMNGDAVGMYTATVTFGEYGAPDFNSRIEAVGRAATTGIMSIEAQVNELWGDSKDDDWKTEEAARIRFERGIETAEPPAVGEELNAEMGTAGGLVHFAGAGTDTQLEMQSEPPQ